MHRLLTNPGNKCKNLTDVSFLYWPHHLRFCSWIAYEKQSKITRFPLRTILTPGYVILISKIVTNKESCQVIHLIPGRECVAYFMISCCFMHSCLPLVRIRFQLTFLFIATEIRKANKVGYRPFANAILC